MNREYLRACSLSPRFCKLRSWWFLLRPGGQQLRRRSFGWLYPLGFAIRRRQRCCGLVAFGFPAACLPSLVQSLPLGQLSRVACQVLPVKGGRLGAVAVDTPYLASCRSARSLSPHAMSVEEPIELRITPLQHAQDLPRLPAVEAEALDEAHPYAQATMPPAALQTQHDSVRHAGPVRRRRLAVVTAGVAGEEGVEEAEACGGKGPLGLPCQAVARGVCPRDMSSDSGAGPHRFQLQGGESQQLVDVAFCGLLLGVLVGESPS